MMRGSIWFGPGSGVVVSPFAYAPSPGGRIVLFGSGETARAGRRVHELLLATHEKPVPVAILETPAGFQPNVSVLSEKVKVFFEHNLQNFKPQVTIVPARYRGEGPHGTDEASLCEGIESAAYVFAGAGSPTYATRHLANTRVWQAVLDRLESGATLALASAMALAVSAHTLPVYEIYKVGGELFWATGLDLLGGLNLDLDLGREEARVHGAGTVSILRDEEPETYQPDETFPISRLRR
jgi:hypothetical protein